MLPVVLHHGIFGFNRIRIAGVNLSPYFGLRIPAAIAALGHRVVMTQAHPTSSIQHRAGQLEKEIREQLGDTLGDNGKIILVAHSMGGLDARYLITKMGWHDRVAALVTICTPHRGSSYADWCIKHLIDPLNLCDTLGKLGIDIAAARDLTRDAATQFNVDVPDVPGVAYFSVAGVTQRPNILFAHSFPILTESEGDNDGIVSLTSAQWGTFLGHWPVDHNHAVNRKFRGENVAPRYAEAIAAITHALEENRPQMNTDGHR